MSESKAADEQKLQELCSQVIEETSYKGFDPKAIRGELNKKFTGTEIIQLLCLYMTLGNNPTYRIQRGKNDVKPQYMQLLQRLNPHPLAHIANAYSGLLVVLRTLFRSKLKNQFGLPFHPGFDPSTSHHYEYDEVKSYLISFDRAVKPVARLPSDYSSEEETRKWHTLARDGLLNDPLNVQASKCSTIAKALSLLTK